MAAGGRADHFAGGQRLYFLRQRDVWLQPDCVVVGSNGCGGCWTLSWHRFSVDGRWNCSQRALRDVGDPDFAGNRCLDRNVDDQRSGPRHGLAWVEVVGAGVLSVCCGVRGGDRIRCQWKFLVDRRDRGRGFAGRCQSVGHIGTMGRWSGYFRSLFRRQSFAAVGHDEPCGRNGRRSIVRSHPTHVVDDGSFDDDCVNRLHGGWLVWRNANG